MPLCCSLQSHRTLAENAFQAGTVSRKSNADTKNAVYALMLAICFGKEYDEADTRC